MKLFVIVVIYKMLPRDSPTLESLIRSAKELQEHEGQLSVLVWDNTPGGQEQVDLPPGFRYIADPANPGLSKAYNRATTVARAEGCEWLLTLDQDTLLPKDFLPRILRLTDELEETTEVAAIVPGVKGDGRSLSPFRFIKGIIPQGFPSGFEGIYPGPTYAVNSAATLRVSALEKLGGYNPLFPLDISDIDLFHRLHQTGHSVFVAGDIVVSHDFSLLNKHKRMSLGRYHDQLRDECAFWDMNMSWLARGERIARLAGRVCKDFVKPGESNFRRLTIYELNRRLTTRRTRRIAEWKTWANSRMIAVNHDEGS